MTPNALPTHMQPPSSLALVESEDVQAILTEFSKHFPSADTALISKAFAFAAAAHDGQIRESGQPYIIHPSAVAYTLAQMGLDQTAIISALLHDVPEDTTTTVADVEAAFGSEVARIVDGVTKLSKFAGRSREMEQAENLRKLILAMAEDLRVVLVKLADRLHNMRTLHHSPPDKQRRIAQQTFDIYAPLARRLGIAHLHHELEDLAFMYLEPDAYQDLWEEMHQSLSERSEVIEDTRLRLQEALQEAGITATLSGRPKHIYSTAMKMRRKNVPLAQIYDLLALRIVTDSVANCYGALGVVHALWPPVPGEFDDYIAVPKSNLYRSLHTAVIGPKGVPIEVQIRTRQMHEDSEMGVAAHFRYKEGSRADTRYEQKLSWVRSLLEWREETADAESFVERLKTDVFSDQVFVFTPKGEIKELAAGATGLDFAYRIHTDVGHRTTGIKINGRIAPLDAVLHSGDIVEVLTSKNKAPSRDWLNIVKTPGAAEKIRQFFRKQARSENIIQGRLSLEHELARIAHRQLTDILPEALQTAVSKLNYNDPDSLFAAIGYGDLKVSTALAALGVLDDSKTSIPATVAPQTPGNRQVSLAGMGDMLTVLAACCRPVPGEPIIGYVTRGRGVSVHKRSCTNVREDIESERQIELDWGSDDQTRYPVVLKITAHDRAGLVRDISEVLAGAKMRMTAMDAQVESNDAQVTITIETVSLEQLYGVIAKLERVNGVSKVARN